MTAPKRGVGKPNIVLVEWRDARFYSGTRKKDEVEGFKMVLFESIGFLISRDPVTTVIAGERNDDEAYGYGDITLIPTGSIVSMRKLAQGQHC